MKAESEKITEERDERLFQVVEESLDVAEAPGKILPKALKRIACALDLTIEATHKALSRRQLYAQVADRCNLEFDLCAPLWSDLGHRLFGLEHCDPYVALLSE